MREKTREDRRITYRPKHVHDVLINKIVDEENIPQTEVIDRAMDTLMNVQNLHVFVEIMEEQNNSIQELTKQVNQLQMMVRHLIVNKDKI